MVTIAINAKLKKQIPEAEAREVHSSPNSGELGKSGSDR
jgi:hypothetical protein